MKLYECQAKKIFKDNNIPIPNGTVCSTEKEAKDAFASIGKGQEVILKSQVLVGGRGKSGGVRSAKSVAETADIFKGLMNTHIKGFPVARVLIEEKIEIRNEYYVGITIDPTFYKPILLISSRGGMEVETIAKESPSALGQYIVNPRYGIPSYEILGLIGELGISSGLSAQLIDIIKKLYTILGKSDATLIEINPLVESSDGRLIAVDARLNIDNNAFFKHGELEELSMELAMRTVSSLNDVKSILINMFGGLTRMDEVATSFIAAWQNMGGLSLPIVIRLEGTNVEEGRRIMKENGFEMFTDLYDAVQKAVDLVGK